MYTIGQEDNQETKQNPNSAYWNRQRPLLLINTSQDNLPIKVTVLFNHLITNSTKNVQLKHKCVKLSIHRNGDKKLKLTLKRQGKRHASLILNHGFV